MAFKHVPEGADVCDFSRAGLSDGNRWNVGGEPTLYFGDGRATVMAEWDRHLREDRGKTIAHYTRPRDLYKLRIRVKCLLDLRAAETWQALSLLNAPTCFLDRAVARATAQFVRKTTGAQALLLPSVAFLDNLEKWVLVLFLEKLGTVPGVHIVSAKLDCRFHFSDI
jgi:hypothetical protein